VFLLNDVNFNIFRWATVVKFNVIFKRPDFLYIREISFEAMRKLIYTLFALAAIPFHSAAQAPGCPNIIAPADQVLPCGTPCTNLTSTPFHVGNTTTYTVGAVPYAPVVPYNQAGGTGVSVGTDDVYSGLINLPFPFCFYGNTYTQCVIGSNGNISFNTGYASGFCPWSFTANCPSNTLPLNSIFGVYHDIDPSICGNVKYHLLGTAPCRMLVVNFNQVCHFSCTSIKSSTQMVLYETTNVIEVYTNAKPLCSGWNGGRAIIGIQNATGTVGLAAPGRNSTPTWAANAAGEGWRFTPNGPAVYTTTWWQGATQIGTGNTITVCPTVSPTTYTARVVYTRCDGVQITDQDDVVISFSTLNTPTVTPTAESCNGYNNGSVVIDNAVGAGPYTVQITGPANPPSVVEANTAGATASFTNLPDGTYNYTVTGAGGCTTTGTFTINPGPACCSVTAAGTNATCNLGTNGTATASPTGLAGFTYSWNSSPVQTTQTATNLGVGTYTVTMTDASGCVATASYTVTQPTAITGSLTVTNATCNGTCNGSITVTGAGGGTGALQYQINGGAFQASNTFTGLCAGSYTVVIKDASGCTKTLTATVTQPTALTVTPATVVSSTCGGSNGSITATGAGGTLPYQFSLNGGALQSSGTFAGLAPGNYTVTVQDANGCTANTTTIITINNLTSPTASVGTLTNVLCFGGANGQVIINATGGTGSLTYDLNPGPGPQASNTFTNLTAGTYSVVVADINNCQTTVPVTITQPTQVSFTSVKTDVTCNGQCNGTITVTASGGTPPYQYSSNGGLTYQASNVLSGLCAGTINVVTQDANGCIANANVVITQPAALTATYTPTNPICQGICNGQISVATSAGGTAPCQFNINGGAFQSGTTFTGLCSGTQTLIIKDANGCQTTSTVNLVDPPGYTVDTVFTDPSNCGFNDGNFQVVASGGSAPYSYNNVTIADVNTTGIFNNVVAGAYEILVTDALGCQETYFVGISDIQMSGTLLSQTDPTCPGTCDGTVDVIATGGFGTITYDLDNTFTQFGSGTFNSICDGSHAITLTDQGFCVFVIPFNLTEPAPIVYTTAATNVTCNGGNNGQITFNAPSGGTAPYQYSIDNGTTFQASPTFTGLTAGTYNVVVRDANNCLQAATATITEPTTITFTTSHTDLTCFGNASGTITIVASGGTGALQYSINGGTTYQSSFSFFALAAGTYNISVKDANNCVVTGTVTVAEPAALSATYTSTPATCNGVCDGTIQVNASGGTTPYLYSSNNGVVYQTASLLAGLCAGSHQVFIKDANNCLIGTTQSITEPTAITFTTVLNPSTCGLPNGDITITANGGTSGYQYSIDNGATLQASNAFTGLAANTYPVLVEDANGCQVMQIETITNEASPVITAVFVTDVNCNAVCDGIIDVTASGGTGALQYNIGGANQAAGVFNAVCANTYTVTVTDANGCQAVQTATVAEPTALTLTATPTALLCNGDNSGEISIVANGGVTPYLYSYDNGATLSALATQNLLAAGNYTVLVQDAHGCQTPANVTVTEPTALAIASQTSTNASCFGVCDGDATVNVTGGTSSGLYTYTWGSAIGGPNQNTVTGICAGTYSLDIADDNGCSISTVFNITEPAAVVISSFTATDALCTGSCDGTVDIVGVNTVQYSVDNGASFQASPNFTGLCAGVYSIVAQDANGCNVTASATINEPSVLVMNTISDITICYDGFGILSASATGGAAPYTFTWNTGDVNEQLNVNLTAPATFTATVTDANGCTAGPQSANVAVIPAFIPTTSGDIDVCPGSPATITASATLGVPTYTFTWFYGNDTLIDNASLTFVPTAPTTVMLVAEDDCPTQDTLYINVGFLPLPTPDIAVSPASGCAPLVVNFTNNTPAGQMNGNCSWDFGNGSSSTGCGAQSSTYNTPGCYDVTLTVTSPDGCVGDSTFTDIVCVFPNPIADFDWLPTQPTVLNSLVNFSDASINGASYVWDFAGQGNSTAQNPSFLFENPAPGEYTVCLQVTSAQGCVDDTCKNVTIYDEFLLYVPNAFTPDNDGINDVFLPVVNGVDPEYYEFMIFNRWGELIFATDVTNKAWDGTHRGMDCKQDVYVWKIKARDALTGDQKEYYGHVTLMR
jgi:gliding motility-associated-like protein